ncbi:hypothetical protein IM40_01545 [Candidatus Paracaedimonas acanthamoebae]|nr:hypothetical protein IM40_01545 [Candidatus Paracaedimonas acanthamoebae]
MTKSKKYLLMLIIFSLIHHLKSFASLPELEEKGPEIIQHTITGAGEFAKLTEEYLQDASQNTVFLADVHGIITNYSDPNHQTWDWEENKATYEARGDMVPYFWKEDKIEPKYLTKLTKII